MNVRNSSLRRPLAPASAGEHTIEYALISTHLPSDHPTSAIAARASLGRHDYGGHDLRARGHRQVLHDLSRRAVRPAPIRHLFIKLVAQPKRLSPTPLLPVLQSTYL